MGLMVLVIECVLAALPQNSLIQSYHEHKLPERPPDLQIMGDSVAAGGIRAEQLGGYLAPATNVVNLALSASGPEFPYFILKRQSTAGVLPKAIVYAPSPHTFGSKRIALLVGAYATWPEIAEIAAAGIEPFEVLYGVACKLSYSLRHREQLSELLKGRRSSSEMVPDAAVRVQNGADVPILFPLDKLPAMYRRGFETTDFNMFFAKKFLEEAQKQKIPVYWVVMPVLQVVEEAREAYRFNLDYQVFMTDLERDFGVELLISEKTIYPPAYFTDYIHLNEKGGGRFTEALGAELVRELRPVQSPL